MDRLAAAAERVAREVFETLERPHVDGPVPGNARKCTDLHAHFRANDRTNPPRNPPRVHPGPIGSAAPPRALAPRQLRAIELLLGGKTIVATARLLDINESTIRRWKHDERFLAEINRRARPVAAAPRAPTQRGNGIGWR
jgi:hypothetical protein